MPASESAGGPAAQAAQHSPHHSSIREGFGTRRPALWLQFPTGNADLDGVILECTSTDNTDRGLWSAFDNDGITWPRFTGEATEA